MIKENKMNWFERIDLIIFIISLIIILVSIPSIINKNCSGYDYPTFLSALISLSCNYGLKGFFFFLISIILIVTLIILIGKRFKSK